MYVAVITLSQFRAYIFIILFLRLYSKEMYQQINVISLDL